MNPFCSDVSVLERRWEVRSGPEGAPAQVVLKNGWEVSPEVVAIAARRGAGDVAAFLEPSLRHFMPDPSVLSGMDEAVDRFARAVRGRERVAILGDYDVDGATSTALLLRYLRLAGCHDAIFHIPHRLNEGYGPNVPAVQGLQARGATLLVIADSGTSTSAFPPIAWARENGMDVVVLDHHEPNEDGSLPPAVVVNPKLPSNDGSLSYLCTAGLAFLFLVGVNRQLRNEGFYVPGERPEPKLTDLLGLVALGTVADVVPLVGLNRAYVSLGVDQMPLIPGLAALMSEAGDGALTSHACGFVYGPCINAAGRIHDTRLGTILLSSDDADEYGPLAKELVELNRQRQDMQKEMVASCIEKVGDRGPEDAVIVVYDPSWHPGVVGLGASKVKDRFDRSAVVIGKDGKGSGRSVEGFNMGKAFLKAAASGLLKKGGGHAAAAGLTIDPARVDEFRAFLNEESRGIVRPPTKLDMAVRIGGLSVDAIEDFELLGPFGMGNPKPRVAFHGGILDDVRLLKEKHVKARLVLASARARIDVILFNGVGTPLGEALRLAEGHYVDILGEASINEYGGRTTVQVKPHDAMIGAPATELAAARAA